jgi:prevent-host-death family protein
MKAAKVSELKAGLSKYLARVKRGEQVVITERGRTIAKIIPVPPAEGAEEERMRELERLGIVSIPEHPGIPPEYWTLELPKDPDDLVLKALLEEREERR